MENSGGIGASLAGRYAIALVDLTQEAKQIDVVTASLGIVRQALERGPGLLRIEK